MKKLIYAILCCSSLAANAEQHMLSWWLPTEGANGAPLPAGSVRGVHLQCAPGTSSAQHTGAWTIDEEVAAPVQDKSYDFANGAWVCRATALMATNYNCASITAPDGGVWSFGSTSADSRFGKDILLNGVIASGGVGMTLVLTGGEIWTDAGIAPIPDTWWRWAGALGWDGPKDGPPPSLGANDPQIRAIPVPQCASPSSPDITFTIPIVPLWVSVGSGSLR